MMDLSVSKLVMDIRHPLEGVLSHPPTNISHGLPITAHERRLQKIANRQQQEEAKERKAASDTKYFWDLVARLRDGSADIPPSMRRQLTSNAESEASLFAAKLDSSESGAIDESLVVHRVLCPQDDLDNIQQLENVPVVQTFQMLSEYLPPSVSHCLDVLRYETLTPIQRHAIPFGLMGLDILCCAQTGCGKTLSYLIPIVTQLVENSTFLPTMSSSPMAPSSSSSSSSTSSNSSSSGNFFHRIPANFFTSELTLESSLIVTDKGVQPLCVILAPSRELVLQVYMDTLRLTMGTSLRTVCLHGGPDIMLQLWELSFGCHIIISTPGRLNDLTNHGAISLSRVRFGVLDEADRMLDMGFEPQIRRIFTSYDFPKRGDRQLMIMSATFGNSIQTLAKDLLSSHVSLSVGKMSLGMSVENVKQVIIKTTSNLEDKLNHLVQLLDANDGRILVFVQKRRTATWLRHELSVRHGIAIEDLHGNRSLIQRDMALKQFREGAVRVLVATDVASRGLEIPLVSHVIQFDMPLSAEEFPVYLHRIGRTGRGGVMGLATSFFVPGKEAGEGNGKIVQSLIDCLQENFQTVPKWLTKLDVVYPYHGDYRTPRNQTTFNRTSSRNSRRHVMNQPAHHSHLGLFNNFHGGSNQNSSQVPLSHQHSVMNHLKGFHHPGNNNYDPRLYSSPSYGSQPIYMATPPSHSSQPYSVPPYAHGHSGSRFISPPPPPPPSLTHSHSHMMQSSTNTHFDIAPPHFYHHHPAPHAFSQFSSRDPPIFNGSSSYFDNSLNSSGIGSLPMHSEDLKPFSPYSN